ncbi:hypothetical protein [Microtetraspora malaysiensis]|uniref:hypothetical protein n=1 Tax=Microtetraspora malaysiensis TaxID=161358 RepID=UPI003D8C314B
MMVILPRSDHVRDTGQMRSQEDQAEVQRQPVQACRQRAYRTRSAPARTSPAHRPAEQVATSARRAADVITAHTDAGLDLGRARAALAELAAMCDETRAR